MAPTSHDERARALHEWYCQSTGQNIKLTMRWLTAWTDWLAADYNGKQLALVIRYLRKQIGENRRNHGALTLQYLLNLENFEKDLGLAQMWTSGGLRTDKKLAPLPEMEGGPAAQGSAASVLATARKIASDIRPPAPPIDPMESDEERNRLINLRLQELDKLRKSL